MGERDAFGEVDAVLSGYQGGTHIGDVILGAVEQVKAANPDAIYACDPVMGNAKSGCFVHPDIPVLLRERVVPKADLITPNQFGSASSPTPSRAISSPRSPRSTRLRQWVPRRCSSPPCCNPTARPTPSRCWPSTATARGWCAPSTCRSRVNGSGDVTAALFTTHLLQTGDPALALGRLASSVWDLVKRTLDSGRREAPGLVQSQEQIAHPRMQFEVEKVR